MSNSYYNHGSYPTTGAPGASSALRAELDLITTGFALLPTLSGNANKALVINAGGSAVTVTTGTLALAGNFATTGAFNTTLVQGATTSLTLPVVSGTLATLAGTETLSNKTLVAPALGTPASGIMTNVTGTAAGLTAGNVTTNANLTGDVTSVGNATSIAAGVIVNADINASAAIDDTKLATIATALKVSNSATTAASANTASAIVSRDASGNFSAGTVTAALTGNASTATALATGRTIAITGDLAYTSPSFDGTGNVTAAGTLATVATAGATGSSTAIPVITINVKGLTTSITTAVVVAPAGTLTGATLASGVTGSSLTSLGTIASLVVTAGTISTTPSGSTDIANKSYVDTIAQGLDTKASVVAGTTANITLSGAQTIDGISIVATDRVLVKDQTAPAENGIYLCAAGAWTRATDMNTWAQVPGAYVFVETGTTLADTGWVCTSNAGGTLGTTAITWAQFSGAGSGVSSITFGTTGLTPSTTTTGAVTVAGTLAVANGGTGLTSGTSGGVLAYTASGTLASSSALAASALVIGGGAGAAPSTTTTGTGVVTALGVNTGSAGAFVVNGGVLGTPSSATLTNATGLPISTGVSGLGTGIATALAVNVGTAGSPVVNGGALGSPSTAGTMPAFTLGGTVSGGGNQINNVIIGTVTPLAGAFTTVSATNPSESLTLRSGNTTRSYLTIGRTAYEAGIGVAGSNLLLGTGDVAGDLDIFTNTATGKINFSAGNTGSIHASLSTTGLAVTGTLSATGTLSGGTSGTGYSFSGSAPATSLTLDSSGNLGLGVTSTSPFSGANTLGKLVVQNNATGVNIALVNNSNDAYTYITNDGSYLTFQNSYYTSAGQKPMRWIASGSQDMTLDSSGNLGIGTSSPAGLLEVRKDQNSPTYTYITNQSTGASGQAILRMANSATGMNLAYTSSGYSTVVNYDVASGGYLASAGSGGLSLAATDSTAVIRFYSGGTTERARIDSSGNLGIGTSSPDNNAGYTALSISNTTGGQVYFRSTTGTVTGLVGADNSGGGLGYLATNTNHALALRVNNTEVARLPTTGGFQSVGSISVGNVAPTTSGAGITFPATQSASTDANTLDDYEEGTTTVTFTPLTSGTITLNASYQTIAYTKVGRVVTVVGELYVTSVSSPVGTSVDIGNLPFAASSASFAFSSGFGILDLGTGSVSGARVNRSNNTIDLRVNASTITGGYNIVVGFSYLT